MKDIEMNRKFGIPLSTLQDWKKSGKDNWRFKMYMYLKDTREQCPRFFDYRSSPETMS